MRNTEQVEVSCLVVKQTCCAGKAGAPEFLTRQQHVLGYMHVCVCGLACQRPDLKFVCARSLVRVLVLARACPLTEEIRRDF
jgi:hypothetical protein